MLSLIERNSIQFLFKKETKPKCPTFPLLATLHIVTRLFPKTITPKKPTPSFKPLHWIHPIKPLQPKITLQLKPKTLQLSKFKKLQSELYTSMKLRAIVIVSQQLLNKATLQSSRQLHHH